MDRVFLKIGSINIYWYSILIILAILIGYYFSKREATKNDLGSKYLEDLLFYLIIISVIGARLYYIIFNYSVFKDNFLSIFKVWEGGLAIYGAIISSFIFIIYYAKKHHKSILLTTDTLVPYLILGQAIGRWGNFLNKEAYGTVTTLSHLKHLHLPNFIIEGMYINGNYYLPTFLYESLWCLIGFMILLIIRKKSNYKPEGLLLSIYLIWYSLGRFFIEGLRSDSLYLGIFRVSQVLSVILFITGIIMLIKILCKDKNKTFTKKK